MTRFINIVLPSTAYHSFVFQNPLVYSQGIQYVRWCIWSINQGILIVHSV